MTTTRSTINRPRTGPSRLHRWGGTTAVAAVVLGGFLAGGQGTAAAEQSAPEPTSAASFTWRISEYVTSWLPGGTPGTQGTSTESGHVTRANNGSGWTFTDGVRSVSAAGVTTIAFDATVDIRPYTNFGIPTVQILIKNPVLSVDAAGTGTLKATVSSVGQTTSTPAVVATLADFTGATVTPDGTNPALSTFAATPSYAGTGVAPRVDSFPVTFVNALDASLQPFFFATGSTSGDPKKVAAPISGQWTAPGITVAGDGSPLPWGTSTLNITGKGYNPASPGVYLAVGPVDVRTTNPTDWNTNAALYSAFAWVRGGAGGDIAADGSFTTTLDVKPVPGQSKYAVYTFRAHGMPDRSQDSATAPFEFRFPFPDYPAAGEFAAPIAWMAQEGISTGFEVPGYSTREFKPNDNAARDAAAAFFYRLAGKPATPACTTAPFTDVKVNHQFCKEISWAKSVGLINGFTTGKYHSADPIDRAAFAAITYRFANNGARAPKCTSQPFTDVKVKDEFCGEIAWAAAQGITKGHDDGTFLPNEKITRQALAAFLYRLTHPAV
ncbi:S-layer homology domain-containing protein [Nakamurella silvestris]|nr:S-layer homology domain-containing protein [Nakamurella silvestris]